MLTIELINQMTGECSVKCEYDQDYVKRLREINSIRFDNKNKYWILHYTLLPRLEELFAGEYYYKTPRWVIMKEPMPDFTKLYQVTDYPIPAMKLAPFNYQEYGIRFMLDALFNTGFVINADDVGIGKTIQTLGVIAYLAEHHNVRRILILCKKSIRVQWLLEGFQKFLYTHGIVVEGSTAKKRKEKYKDFTDYMDTHNNQYPLALVTNYHTVLSDHKEISDIGFDLLVVDEAHNVKNPKGKMNNMIKKITKKTPYKVFLTGTPIMTSPVDVYGIVSMASSSYFGPWSTFDSHYIKRGYRGRFKKIIGYRHLDELREKVQSIIIRRTEHEIDIQLPDLITKKHVVPMDSIQKKMHDLQRQQMAEINEQLNDKGLSHWEKVRLQQQQSYLNACSQSIANDPRLLVMSTSQHIHKIFLPLLPVSYKMSPKTEAILDLIENVVAAGHKIILFSKYERQVRLLMYDIEKVLKLKALSITGQMTDEDRNTSELLFKTNPDYKILIGTDAMAEGLNLQMSKHIVHIDQSDTLAIKTQRNGRVRRAGSQFDRAYTYDMITIGSYDEDRLKNIEKQSEVTDSIVSLDIAQRNALVNAMK